MQRTRVIRVKERSCCFVDGVEEWHGHEPRLEGDSALVAGTGMRRWRDSDANVSRRGVYPAGWPLLYAPTLSSHLYSWLPADTMMGVWEASGSMKRCHPSQCCMGAEQRSAGTGPDDVGRLAH